MANYKIPIEDWTKINLDNAEFILKEAKDYVVYLNTESDRITERAFSMIKILLPTVVVLIGIFARSASTGKLGWIEVCTLAAISLAFYFLYQFYKLTFPRVYKPLGRNPKELGQASFYGVDPAYDEKESKIALYMNEIENSGDKIEYNEGQNLSRSKKLSRNMKGTWVSILLVSIAVIVFSGASYWF